MDQAAKTGTSQSKEQSIRALNALNFFLADVQTGVGPFLVVFLATGLHWLPSTIGWAMGISGLVGVVAQLPSGAIMDATRHKRLVVVGACALIVVASLAMGYFPTFLVISSGQSMVAMCGAIFGPAVAAISLGLVGRSRLDNQIGRNQTFNSAGNVLNAVALGICGYYSARLGIFWFVAAISLVAGVCVYRIRHGDIDYHQARGSDRDPSDVPPDDETGSEVKSDPSHITPLSHLFKDRRILAFALAAILFHFANGGLGPLVSQVVARQQPTRAMLYQSAMTVVAQLVVTALGWWVGRRASQSLRKPIYLAAFVALPMRALLYLFVRDASALVGLQVLDGIGAGVFGIMQLLVVADLTKGTGRFNLAQGALATAVGIGASVSNVVAGTIVRLFGFEAGFGAMAGIALLALGFFWQFVPETKVEAGPSADRPKAYMA